MAEKTLEFLQAPKENLETWNKVSKLMLISAAVTLVFLLLLALIVF